MKKRNSIFGLILCMLACTLFTVGGVFASLNQSLATNGSVNVISYGHVDATITFEIEEASFTKTVTIEETEAKQTYSVEGFAEAFEDAFHGNVETDENDGRIDVKDTATVNVTITNTSVDYDLASYALTLTETNKVNMKTTTVVGNTTGTNVAKNGGSVVITYTIKVDDLTKSASGDYAWSLTLVAANNI